VAWLPLFFNTKPYGAFMFGVGLRAHEIFDVLQHPFECDRIDITSDDYLHASPAVLKDMDQLRALFPITLHGEGLSIGGSDPINTDYLKALKVLIDRIEPMWVSDYLGFTGVDGKNMHMPLPLPMNADVLEHVAARIHEVQAYLGRPLVIENVQAPLIFTATTYTEYDFFNALVRESGCRLSLNLNTIQANAERHSFSSEDYIGALNADAVVQLRVGAQVAYPLYEAAIARFPDSALIVERDMLTRMRGND
jgi:uncharacterized protein